MTYGHKTGTVQNLWLLESNTLLNKTSFQTMQQRP